MPSDANSNVNTGEGGRWVEILKENWFSVKERQRKLPEAVEDSDE